MSQTYFSSDRDTAYRTPRWVKVLGIAILALILLMGVLMLASSVQHGPGMHMPSASVTEVGTTGEHTSPGQHGG